MQKSFDFSVESIRQLAQSDVARALLEDLGSGDLTASLIDPTRMARARVLARESAVVCGQAWVQAAVLQCDPQAQITWHVQDGQRCQANQVVLEVQGRAQALLTAERTALNFLQLLSGVATKTAGYVAIVAGTRAHIVDTRKTLPGLRLAQKYAVRTGGGTNHRVGLYDAILIKENHIAAAGGIPQVMAQAAHLAAQADFVEIEVETLAQLAQALDCGAKMVLLDNMDLPTLHEAVRMNAAKATQAILEISGGVTLEGLRALAETGVDRISIGTLTKDVQSIDYSMRFETLKGAL
jgi:nicotinate-nucleotide pyrophosphorylase (carboxylating)